MSNKRIGCENFGKFYTEGKVRNRREWRGVVDTLYDYSRWLHNWITMAKMVSKPRNIKAMFRYRWMANYLAVPMMVDRHTQGLRGEHLRICHLEQDLIIEDVAKLLDGLFRGDRRIGNDTEFSKKVVHPAVAEHRLDVARLGDHLRHSYPVVQPSGVIVQRVHNTAPLAAVAHLAVGIEFAEVITAYSLVAHLRLPS